MKDSASGVGVSGQVAGLTVGQEYNGHFEQLFKAFITQLSTILPPGTNIPAAYERGSDEEQDFVQNLALFFTAFFRVSACP
jgi:exportin-1